jgi:hypothetical protein
MTKEERVVATELAQVKLLLRRIEAESARLGNKAAGAMIDEACGRIQTAIKFLEEPKTA